MIKQLNKSTVETVGRPVRILQFGEGNFLRAFVDWQIDIANEKGVMDAGVAVCQPIIDPEHKVLGMIDLMHKQDNMYHVYLEGIENKRPKKDVRLVKSIMDSFNPYVDYAKYEAYFLSPELKITISNTTEAGIRYEEGDDLTACPPKSYPAKMTALLYKRFKHFNGDPTKGLCIICCELIENNGSTLHEYVIRHAEYHKLGQDFIDWVWREDMGSKWHSEQTSSLDTFGIELAGGYTVSEGFLRRVTLSYGYITTDRNADVIAKSAMDFMRHKAALAVEVHFLRRMSLALTGSVYDRNGSYTHYPEPGNASLNEERDYKPYFLLDGRLQWEKGICRLYVDATNITDTRYCDIGGIRLPGFWCTGGVTLTIGK